MKRRNLTALALMVALAALAACGGEKSEQQGNWITGTNTTGTDTSGTATGTHPGSPGGTALVPETSAGVTAVLSVQEGRILPPATPLPPGPVVFTVTNAGTESHSIHIEGPGVSKAADQTLAPGATQAISVTLQQGTYTLYCPLLDHRNNGESITFTTGTDPATSTAVPTDTAATGTSTQTQS